MKLFAAALLACALPAFGQEVREQLATQLHENCVAHAQETLHDRWRMAPTLSFDTPKFCACADAQIQGEPLFERIARMPESERGPSSWVAHSVADLYLLHGIDCYSKTVGWPPAALLTLPSRSLEEVRVVLETRKGALFAAYNRALRRNPNLAGKVVLEFMVEPAGDVTNVNLQSSELADEQFLAELKSVVGRMSFPAEAVRKLVTTYPMDFRPQ